MSKKTLRSFVSHSIAAIALGAAAAHSVVAGVTLLAPSVAMKSDTVGFSST